MYHAATITDSPPQTGKVALLGNPNCGKSSIFNQLTGLRQKTGNFPGVTVDRKEGKVRLANRQDATIIDFPGTYSLYPNSQDERIVAATLCDPTHRDFPQAVLYIADITQLEKHLLLFTQILDLGIPCVLAINMSDVAKKEGISVNAQLLSKQFRVPVVFCSGRTGEGIDALKAAIQQITTNGEGQKSSSVFYQPDALERKTIQLVRQKLPIQNDYQALLIAHHYRWLPSVNKPLQTELAAELTALGFNDLDYQVRETMARYDRFTPLVKDVIQHLGDESSNTFTRKIDRILTHRVFGPFLFLLIMLLVFQAIFSWASYPMEWIDAGFGAIGSWISAQFPDSFFASLLTDGILAGLGGILIFIPQIAILFFLIALLEEVGYMARVVYLFDSLMQRFGLGGRSIVALVSGGACAIPAVMSTRTIANWKERLITILVTPLISCSARIPVYTVLIGFVVPEKFYLGFFNLQGLAFMGLYLLSILAALVSAYVFKKILKSNQSSFLLLEMPVYRWPVLRNVLLSVYEKVKTFTLEAGKVIMIISVVLWFLASFGPSAKMELATQQAETLALEQQLDELATADLVAARRIEASYAGHLGKFIEPAIRPLGFDWKIGIALVTSFAAREVFVGTMATIYSIGSVDDEFMIRDKMAREKDPVTGQPIYTLATSLSLLLFYVFAMQCMSTLAVVRQETRSWKWPAIQFLYMTAMAYGSSWAAYQIFS